MKRLIALLLLIALCLCGCAGDSEPDTSADFYYLRSEITYGSHNGVIACESRKIGDTEPELTDLLTLYLDGPTDGTLSLPLPSGTRLTEITLEETELTLVFSEELSDLEDMELTAVCACIGYTCLSNTDAEVVRIEAPASAYGSPVSFIITRETFLLFDNTTREADAS